MDKQASQKKGPKVKPHTEDFKKIKGDGGIGIMKHKDGTVEKRKF